MGKEVIDVGDTVTFVFTNDPAHDVTGVVQQYVPIFNTWRVLVGTDVLYVKNFLYVSKDTTVSQNDGDTT